MTRLRRLGDCLRRGKSPLRAAGLSLIEVSIALAISTVVVSAIYTVLKTAVGGDRDLRVRLDLQLDAVRILREVTDVLKNSGPIDLDSSGTFEAGDYPYLWTDGTSNGSPYGGYYAYLDGTNPGIIQQATSAYDGQGASQEIAFRLPRDVDGDGRPTQLATGQIEWGTDTYAIVLVPGTYGNELQLRRYNSSWEVISTRLLGRHVERITFETAATEPKPVVAPQQPLGANQLRVTAWFRRIEETKLYTVKQTSTVNMRSVGH